MIMPKYLVGFQGPGGYTPHAPIQANSFEDALTKANGPTLEETIATIMGPDQAAQYILRNGQWHLQQTSPSYSLPR